MILIKISSQYWENYITKRSLCHIWFILDYIYTNIHVLRVCVIYNFSLVSLCILRYITILEKVPWMCISIENSKSKFFTITIVSYIIHFQFPFEMCNIRGHWTGLGLPEDWSNSRIGHYSLGNTQEKYFLDWK